MHARAHKHTQSEQITTPQTTKTELERKENLCMSEMRAMGREGRDLPAFEGHSGVTDSERNPGIGYLMSTIRT